MARSIILLSSCFFTLLILMSLFSISESTRVLARNDDDSFSAHILSAGSLFLKRVKHHFNAGSHFKDKVSYSIGFRHGRKAQNIKYQLQRASPGGPDGHHHFSNINVSRRTWGINMKKNKIIISALEIKILIKCIDVLNSILEYVPWNLF